MNDKSEWYWRLLRWGLIALAGLITLAAVLITEEDWRGKHDWSAYRQAAEARGEHLDLTWVVPPAVPDDRNFFAAPALATALRAERQKNNSNATPVVNQLDLDLWRGDSSLWPTNGNWQMRTLTDLKSWQNYFRGYSQSPAGRTNGFPFSPEPQTPAADVLLALNLFDPAITELRQASQRPEARLPMAYEQGLEDISNLLPWLAIEKRWMQVIELRTLAELQAGRSQPALDDEKLSLRLADTFRDQPFLISHLVRLAMMSLALQSVYEGIAAHQWNDAQLAGLDASLASEDFLGDFQRAMRGERTCGVYYYETMRLTRQVKLELGTTGNELVVTNSLFWTPSAFFYQNELAAARMYDQFILPLADPAKHTISLPRYRAGQDDFQRATNHFSPYSVLSAMTFPSVAKSIQKFALTQAHVDFARLACALERYRLVHGDYPENLEAITPQFIATLPPDIINGQPLHYRRTSEGRYILYSVGWNETDDGGTTILTKAGRIDPEKGDWVWQLPPK